MATFVYEALNASGKPQKGTVEAASGDEAISKIKSQGFYPTQVREQRVAKSAIAGAPAAKKKRKGKGTGIGRVSSKQLTLFTRQLSTLTDAGLPLLRSLQILESQMKPGKLKNVLVDVADGVEGGSSLSEAMAKHSGVFDRLYTKMVAAGEVGGVLDIILQRLSEFMEKAQRLRRRIKGALVYPIVVVVVAIAIVTFIMLFIIPKFEVIFADFGVALPALTMGLIDTSRWMAGAQPGQALAGWIIVVPSPVIVWVFWKLIRKAGPGKALTDRIILIIPVLGGLVRKTTIARFTRTLGTLIAAGVPILEAILITRDTCGHYVFERALNRVHDSIREGETFATPLRESKTCDALVVNMIDVGEETGEMDAMLMKIADNYDEEVDVAVASLVSLLEPIMVVAIGGLVGTIVVAMFMPMVAMINGLATGGGI